MFAECLAVGLACGDQRRLTGRGCALETLRYDALYKSTFTLLFFTKNLGEMRQDDGIKYQCSMIYQCSINKKLNCRREMHDGIEKGPNIFWGAPQTQPILASDELLGWYIPKLSCVTHLNFLTSVVAEICKGSKNYVMLPYHEAISCRRAVKDRAHDGSSVMTHDKCDQVHWTVREHITPILRELHWLPVGRRVELKIASLVYQVLSSKVGYLPI